MGEKAKRRNGSTCETNSYGGQIREFRGAWRSGKREYRRRVRIETRRDAAAVIAPHGGGIEPGTSELAEAIAGADLSFYAFEGLKKDGNGDLHVTSDHFDEATAIELVSASPTVVAVHGELKCTDKVAFLGGLDKDLGQRAHYRRERRPEDGSVNPATRDFRHDDGFVHSCSGRREAGCSGPV